MKKFLLLSLLAFSIGFVHCGKDDDDGTDDGGIENSGDATQPFFVGPRWELLHYVESFDLTTLIDAGNGTQYFSSVSISCGGGIAIDWEIEEYYGIDHFYLEFHEDGTFYLEKKESIKQYDAVASTDCTEPPVYYESYDVYATDDTHTTSWSYEEATAQLTLTDQYMEGGAQVTLVSNYIVAKKGNYLELTEEIEHPDPDGTNWNRIHTFN